MKLIRHLIRHAAACLLFLLTPALGSAAAPSWPGDLTTIVVGYPPGSGMDTVARFLADQLNKKTGHPFVVENKAGALGRLGAGHVAKAKPDGSVMLLHPASLVLYPFLFKDVPFDPVKDVAAVTTVSKVYYVLIVNPAVVKADTVKELTAYIKNAPGKTAYGSGAANPEIAGGSYQMLAGLDSVNVRYTGVPAALTDLLGGRLHFMFADTSLAMPHIRRGTIKALAVAASNRMITEPEIPTMVEAGVGGFGDFSSWMGMFFPAGTPMPIRQKLSGLLNEIMATEEGKALLPRLGMEPFSSDPASTQAFIAHEFERYKKLTKELGIEQR